MRKNPWNNMTQEQRDAHRAKISAAQKARIAAMTPSEKLEFRTKMSAVKKNWWLSASAEDIKAAREKMKQAAKSNAEKRSEYRKRWWRDSTAEEIESAKKKMSIGRKRWWNSLSDDEKKAFRDKQSASQLNMLPETRRLLSEKRKAWWASRTPEQRQEQISKMHAKHRINKALNQLA